MKAKAVKNDGTKLIINVRMSMAFTSVLLRLEEKIDNLENENKALRDLVQIQLTEMKNMLPKPADDNTGKSRKKPFWKF